MVTMMERGCGRQCRPMPGSLSWRSHRTTGRLHPVLRDEPRLGRDGLEIVDDGQRLGEDRPVIELERRHQALRIAGEIIRRELPAAGFSLYLERLHVAQAEEEREEGRA